MITIAKYDAPRETQVTQETQVRIERYVSEQATETAQRVAAQTAETITASATIDANGDLIMTTATATPMEQEISQTP